MWTGIASRCIFSHGSDHWTLSGGRARRLDLGTRSRRALRWGVVEQRIVISAAIDSMKTEISGETTASLRIVAPETEPQQI